jgi:PKD repeat protein
MGKKMFFILLITVMIGAAWADDAAFRMVVSRDDKTVGGEYRVDLEFKITQGEALRTMSSLACDIDYGPQLTEWDLDPALSWAFAAKPGYAVSVNKNLAAYHIVVDGSAVNPGQNGAACDSDTSGWNAANSWQKLVTLRWKIAQLDSANLSINDETLLASHFVNLGNCPQGSVQPFVLLNQRGQVLFAESCTASFAANPETASVGQTVTFTSSTPGALDYSWDFGDGTTATGNPVTHVYSASGSVYANLTVTCGDGSTSTDTDVITIVDAPPPCTATFQAWPLPAVTKQAITFNSTSSNALTYEWNFGDGTTATGNPVTHAYEQAGAWQATLTITCLDSSDTSAPMEIVVNELPPCKASFTTSPEVVEIGLPITFISGSNGAESYEWTFGDGTTATGNPVVHTYTTLGEVYATLKITCAEGQNDSDTDVINVVMPPPCSSSFTADPQPALVGQTITFSSTSTGARGYLWNFGDGTTATGNPVTHTYPSAATWNATLTVTCYDTTITSAPMGIVVNNLPDCFASFSISPEVVTVNQTVTFHSGANGATSHAWDFGDGTTATGNPVSHSFTQVGQVHVTLTITCLNGQTLSDTDLITVQEQSACTAAFTASPNPIAAGGEVTFTSTSSGASSYGWDFGDGGTATGNPVSHTYASGGSFTAKLTISCEQSGTSSATDEIVVQVPMPTCLASFTATPDTAYVGQLISFISDCKGAGSYAWNFGDSTAATGPTATHLYAAAGKYYATLTIDCGQGVTDTDTDEIIILALPPCSAAFNMAPNPACAGQTVTFTASADAANWQWDFGDGSTGTGQVVTHQYAKADTIPYKVVLRTQCPVAGADSSHQLITINGTPAAAFTATPMSGNVPLTVHFTDRSTFVPTGWEWNFGDGNQSTEQNPTHTYTTAGSYTVSLTASNACGAGALTMANYITAEAVYVTEYDYGATALPTARHRFNVTTSIGVNVTPENSAADGSENDGIIFGDMVPGKSTTVKVTVSQNGFVSAWIDFDGNTTDWALNPPTNVITPRSIMAGTEMTYSISIPSNVQVSDQRWIRFRYSVGSLADVNSPMGNSDNANGEVQDYLFTLTPVELSTFTASVQQGSVVLEWRTQSETDNLGFHVYRSEAENGTYEQLSAVMIPGAGTTSSARHYSFEDRDVIANQAYFYKLADVDYSGRMTLHGPIKVVGATPNSYTLEQNYPNPFNPETRISFMLKETGYVNLTIYNLNGQEIRSMVTKQLPAGTHSCTWDGRNNSGKVVPTGTYLYTLRVNGFEVTRKMEFVK